MTQTAKSREVFETFSCRLVWGYEVQRCRWVGLHILVAQPTTGIHELRGTWRDFAV